MTDKLPPNLLALFTPRPPLRWVAPVDHEPQKRHTTQITGIAAYLRRSEQVNELYKDEEAQNPVTQSWLERKDQEKQARRTHKEDIAKRAKEDYDPKHDPNVTGDPLKTLIVARLPFDCDKRDIERELGRFGPIESIRIVTDRTASKDAPPKKKSRGYAFVVFEKSSDFKVVYRELQHGGLVIKNRKCVVDIERGRTVPGWLPRRYGGGLGGRHYSKQPPARPPTNGIYGAPSGPGGFRGGFRGGRGGFRGDFGAGGRNGDFRGSAFNGGGSGGFAGGAPNGAPSGPRSSRGGGYGFGGGGGGGSENRSGPGYDDRTRGSGSNREPVGARHEGGRRYHDRDGATDDNSRKRGHAEDFDEPRQRRRY